ncbi:hypothetical protein TL16_g02213 [Triparma laevis f. inornata]|uniref:PI3K/PI4K catalytic domain-containing protein n=1 Tax=Triparma laevis f. inornata TaxID=1714386 RepID=A0A9W7DWJ0_9STRA|nr:hypothetical protein TL16_g02213 [Triparma laevis f. inornata]
MSGANVAHFFNKVLNYEGEEETIVVAKKSTPLSYLVACVAVLENLRTGLGSPGQTLHAFEVPFTSTPNKQPPGLSRSHTLLRFLWNLERLILHASVGGPNSPFPSMAKTGKPNPIIAPTITFFTANKSVCDTWLAKTAHKVQEFASESRLYNHAAYFAEASLAAAEGGRIYYEDGREGYVGDLEKRSTTYVESLICLGHTDTIAGLKRFLVKKIFEDEANHQQSAIPLEAVDVSQRLAWLDAAALVTKGNFEAAGAELLKMLKLDHAIWGKDSTSRKLQPRVFSKDNKEKKSLAESVVSALSTNFLSVHGVAFAIKLAIRCYTETADWEAAACLSEALIATHVQANVQKLKVAKNLKTKSGHNIRDFMYENVMRDHVVAVDAFQPKIDWHLLSAWGKLEDLINVEQMQTSDEEGTEEKTSEEVAPPTPPAPKRKGDYVTGDYVKSIYGHGVVDEVREDGTVCFVLDNWFLANNQTVKCYLDPAAVDHDTTHIPPPSAQNLTPPFSPVVKKEFAHLVKLNLASTNFIAHTKTYIPHNPMDPKNKDIANPHILPVTLRFEAAEKVLLHEVARFDGIKARKIPRSSLGYFGRVTGNLLMPFKFGTTKLSGMGDASGLIESLTQNLRAASKLLSSLPPSAADLPRAKYEQSCQDWFEKKQFTALNTMLSLANNNENENENSEVDHLQTRSPYYALEGKCLVAAARLEPDASKPYLKLGDWAFSAWVKHVKADPSPPPLTKAAHDLAVTSYCNFLSLLNNANTSKTSYTTIITLRLLKLMSNRPAEASTDTLSASIDSIPPQYWADIIPQLMSLTGHKDEFVRDIAVSCLTNLGTSPDSHPSLASDIAFRVNHGFSETSVASSPPYKVRALEKIKANFLEASANENSKIPTSMFDDIAVLQTEMERLASPWDDKWAHIVKKMAEKSHVILNTLYSEVGKEIGIDNLSFTKPNPELAKKPSAVKAAAAFMLKSKLKVPTQTTLRDFLTFSKSTLSAAQQTELRSFTSTHPVWGAGEAISGAIPSTKAERFFQTTFGADLVALVRWITGADEEEKYELTHMQANFHTMFHTKLCKRFGPGNFKYANQKESMVKNLSQICPKLATLLSPSSPTTFYLPTSDGPIEVASINNKVEVVESKTCPKKVTFIDLVGKGWGYLLKGGEDLRVDERMMQMLNVTNSLLEFDPQSGKRGMNIQTYSILPLSPGSGLIEFVEGPVSLFTLFEKHQQRAAEREVIVASVMGRQPHNSIINLRSMFFKEVGEVMAKNTGDEDCKKKVWKRKGLSKEVLMHVYQNLKGRMPANLLSTAMLLSSDSPADFLAKQSRYTRSAATSSILGWVMGLGDRHPANMLLDLETGDVVHIDYGVIFDAGGTLTCPEVVPFRWTQGVQSGMGVNGADGEGVSAMAHTVRVTRANKEIILTLLEAFISDPVMGRGYGLGLKPNVVEGEVKGEKKEMKGEKGEKEEKEEKEERKEEEEKLRNLKADAHKLSKFVLQASLQIGTSNFSQLPMIVGALDEGLVLPVALNIRKDDKAGKGGESWSGERSEPWGYLSCLLRIRICS